MTEKLIEFETAKLAKEVGFNWFTRNYFGQINAEPFETHENSLDDYNSSRWDEKGGEWISLPTQSLLQKWLRDTHNIHITVDSYHCIGRTKPFGLSIDYLHESGKWDDYVDYRDDTDFETYEEALEKGLVEGLKLIKNEII